MMKESMLESAKEHKTKNERKTKKWMTPEILDLMEERRKAKAYEQKYRELDKQVKNRCFVCFFGWFLNVLVNYWVILPVQLY